MAFTIRYTSGVICAPMSGTDLDRLKLPPMTQVNEDRKGTAYTVSVDARDGISTGISAADRTHTTRLLVDSATDAADLPTEHGDVTAVGYRSMLDGTEHIALVAGGLGPDGRLTHGEDVLVRVHSDCLTGDVFGSLRCDCGPQLHTSLERIADEGRGVLLHLRGHEGRSIGLAPKLRAYQL
jgi:hypothetical protein